MFELYAAISGIIGFLVGGFLLVKEMEPEDLIDWVPPFFIAIGLFSIGFIVLPLAILFLVFKVGMTLLVRKSEEYTVQFSIRKK